MLFHCIACSVHCKEKRPSCRCAVFLFSVTKCRKMSSSDFLILLSAETCLGEVRLQRVEEQGKISNAQQVVECYNVTVHTIRLVLTYGTVTRFSLGRTWSGPSSRPGSLYCFLWAGHFTTAVSHFMQSTSQLLTFHLGGGGVVSAPSRFMQLTKSPLMHYMAQT